MADCNTVFGHAADIQEDNCGKNRYSLSRIFCPGTDTLGLVQRKYKSETGESMGKPEKKLKKIIIISGITGAVYCVFRFLLPLLIPFLIAWGLAVALRPSAHWVAERCRFRITVRDRKMHGNSGGKRVRTIGIPIGLVGMTELLIIFLLLGFGFYFGGRKLCAETRLLFERMPVWIEKADFWLTGICHNLENVFCLKKNLLVHLMREMLRGVMRTMKNAAMPYLMTNSVSLFRWGIGAAVMLVLVFISTGLALQELPVWKKRCRRSDFVDEFSLIGKRLSLVVRAWLKTQAVIILLIAFLCMTAFWIMKNPYYILAGIAVGILDALPVLGTGVVLIPWALFLFFQRQWMRGFMLLALYLICYLLREYLEAKWMGEQVGLSPLENLIAIYVGIQLFGISGVILGPIGLLLIGDLVEAWEGN